MIFLTGHHGFIGSSLTERLNIKKLNFYTTDLNIENRIPNNKIKKGTNTIVNLAGFIPEGNTPQNNLKCMSVNLFGLINLLDAAVKIEINKFIQISSIMVYKESTDEFIDESYITEPNTVYGLSKLCADKYLQEFAEEYKFNYVILRLAFVYGTNMKKNFQFGNWVYSALSGENLNVYGRINQFRDYVYIDDVVEAIIQAIYYDSSTIFNIGTGKKYNALELAMLINKIIGNNKLNIIENSTDDIKSGYVYDISRAKQELKFEHSFDLEKGLTKIRKDYEEKKIQCSCNGSRR